VVEGAGWCWEVKIDVYGRLVTANGKLQFAFEGKFYKFPQVSTGVNSFFYLNAQIILTSNSLMS
jgi:hypothetical protein